MHKIWLINLEEVIGHKNLEKQLLKHLCRYILLMNPGDFLVTPYNLPRDFLIYAASLRELSPDLNWIIKVNNLSEPYYLGRSILLDESLMDFLHNLSLSGNYHLDPFFESPEIVDLSIKTGIPLQGTPGDLVGDGLIRKLNEKTYFKELSSSLDIETIPGYNADSRDSLEKAILEICKTFPGGAIVKKSFSGGGYGNYAGNVDFLLEEMSRHFEGGDYLVEQLLDLENTIGTMVIINDNGIKYLGANTQIIGNYGWIGCRYPFEDNNFSEQVRELSLKYAEKIYQMGARGLLNIDWGVEKRKDGNRRLYALEINLRRNGLNYVLEAAKNCLEPGNKETHLVYFSEFQLSPGIRCFGDILKRMEELQVSQGDNLNFYAPIKKGDRNVKGTGCGETKDGDRNVAGTGPAMQKRVSGGVIFTTPMINQTIGILVAGNTGEYVAKVSQLIKKELGDGDDC